jgi:hypothetical protein
MLAAASIALLSAGVALAHPTMGHHARQNTDKSSEEQLVLYIHYYISADYKHQL